MAPVHPVGDLDGEFLPQAAKQHVGQQERDKRSPDQCQNRAGTGQEQEPERCAEQGESKHGVLQQRQHTTSLDRHSRDRSFADAEIGTEETPALRPLTVGG